MRANQRVDATPTRLTKLGPVTIAPGARAEDVARTLVSIDNQTFADGDVTIHIAANDSADASNGREPWLPPAGEARGARGALRFGVTVVAGARLAPTAIEKIAWTFLSFPDAGYVWASRSPCPRCATQKAARPGASEDPATVLAWRHTAPTASDAESADAAFAIGITIHVTETLSWTIRGSVAGAGPYLKVPRTSRLICLALNPHRLCRPGDPVTFEPGPAISVPAGEPRLLMIVPWLAMGGADKFNLDVMRVLSARGWHVTVATTLSGNDAWHDEFSSLTDDVFMLPRIARLPDWPRIIRHLIETRRVDTVLVTNSEFGYHLLPALRQTAPSVFFADYCHMEQEDWKDGGYPRLAAQYQPDLDRNLVATQHLKHWLAAREADTSKIDVLYVDVDPEEWTPSAGVRAEVRRSLGISEDTTLILFAARLDAQKQPDVLAATLERLYDAQVPYHAVVAGDGPDRARFEARLRRSPAQMPVTMLGAVPNTEVKRLMRAADIFFLPSAMEGLAFAIYEAMACGVCVVGAAVGGQPELVVDGCGVLIDPGKLHTQPEQYAEVLKDLIRRPAHRQALGRAARAQLIRHVTGNNFGPRLDRLLRPPHRVEHRRPAAEPLASAIAAASAAVDTSRLESSRESRMMELPFKERVIDVEGLFWNLRLTCDLDRVLEIGCGTGLFVRRLLEEGGDAFGMDNDTNALHVAEQHVPGRTRFFDAGPLPFADDAFDTIVCHGRLLDRSPEAIERFAAELRRVARRHAAVSVPAGAPGREWWDACFLRAGWRRHPALFRVVDYCTLDAEADALLLYEKIPDAALEAWPLRALAVERDLHMDMLREAGRRSDAHMQRYAYAATLVRQNDVVLDIASGLGYGLAIMAATGRPKKLIGVDTSALAVEYARTMYADAARDIECRQGDAHDLGTIPDHSVHLVVSFETLEHVARPDLFLREVARVLAPGGRFVGSIPNEWLDETGRDPNPHHLHVFDAERLVASFTTPFLFETLIAQTAGGGMKAIGVKGRSWQRVEPAAAATETAEWWIAVAMKDPFMGAGVPYQETVNAGGSHGYRPAAVAFSEAYDNPWLRHALVSAGLRISNPVLLRETLERVCDSSADGSVQQGAALCVLGYQLLDQTAPSGHLLTHLRDVEAWLSAAGQTRHHLRWRVSLEYLAGRLSLVVGLRAAALQWFERCAAHDASQFSPLLATKTVDAAWMAGQMHSCDGNGDAARHWWRAGLEHARLACAADWREVIGDSDDPFVFGLRELGTVLDLATRCAAGLRGLDGREHAPGRTAEMRIGECRAEASRLQTREIESLKDLLQQQANLKGQLLYTNNRLRALREKVAAVAPSGAAARTPVPRVGVFGSGDGAMRVWEALLGGTCARVAWFADNAASRQGQTLLGLDIVAPGAVHAKGFDAIVIGSTSRDAILDQLQGLGVERARVLTPDLDRPVEDIREEIAAGLSAIN
jgi:glycosyltransferase involved in cell wall biosynthesis/SAM-dependent methyltransferase